VTSIVHRRFAVLLWLPVLVATGAVHAAEDTTVESLAQTVEPGFRPVYDALSRHCGNCHVVGGADGPWALDRTPTESSFPRCLSAPAGERERCATYHELVDPPGPGIPAWIDPAVPADSDLYEQACVPGVSFHLGNSLPAEPDETFCKLLLDWIDAGAPY
jgi:hypothetical protein